MPQLLWRETLAGACSPVNRFATNGTAVNSLCSRPCGVAPAMVLLLLCCRIQQFEDQLNAAIRRFAPGHQASRQNSDVTRQTGQADTASAAGDMSLLPGSHKVSDGPYRRAQARRCAHRKQWPLHTVTSAALQVPMSCSGSRLCSRHLTAKVCVTGLQSSVKRRNAHTA
jgi:hypothetical protein